MLIMIRGVRFRVADGFDGPYLIALESFRVHGWRWMLGDGE